MQDLGARLHVCGRDHDHRSLHATYRKYSHYLKEDLYLKNAVFYCFSFADWIKNYSIKISYKFIFNQGSFFGSDLTLSVTNVRIQQYNTLTTYGECYA